MKERTKATVKLNKNGLLVDVAIDMNPQDGDGLYIIHFAIVEETKDELRFSVLATTNLSDAHTEDDLIENTSEIWTIALDNPKAVEKA